MNKSNELYKTANAKTSFICESLLGYVAQDGKQYDKIALVLVLRDGQNKAQTTVRYYLDVPAAKVLMHDLFYGKLKDEFKGFKQYNDIQRALNIRLLEEKNYRVSVMNTNGDKQSLYFDMTIQQAREMAISVLDHVRNYELGKVLALHLSGQAQDDTAPIK